MDLDDLIDQVEGEEPLDRLASAMGVKADVDELTDALIGHFVDQARRAGCSWSEIGAAMGVTKQAAQQRHTGERPPRGRRRGPYFQRFTGRARAAVREAEEAARELRHEEVSSEHLLVGLLSVSQGLAAKVLWDAGITRDAVMAKLEGGDAVFERGRRRRMPFTADGKAVLEGALQEAIQLAHNYIGTEHVLLALYRNADSLAAKVLTDLGADRDRVRDDVVDRLSKWAS